MSKMNRAVLLLGLVVGAGCAREALPRSEPCRYDFPQFGSYAQTATGTSSCTMDVAADAIALTLPDKALTLTIRASSATGYARLESVNTTRAQPNETYGLVDFALGGESDDWGGHTTWSVDGGWRFDLVATSSLGTILNGSVEALPQ